MWWVRGILESWKICPQWLHSHGHCFPSGGGGDVRIRRRGKGKIGEGHKKILVVCKESFKEKVFLWKNILLEKYIFLGKLSLWIVFLGKSILAEKKLVKKKSSLGENETNCGQCLSRKDTTCSLGKDFARLRKTLYLCFFLHSLYSLSISFLNIPTLWRKCRRNTRLGFVEKKIWKRERWLVVFI